MSDNIHISVEQGDGNAIAPIAYAIEQALVDKGARVEVEIQFGVFWISISSPSKLEPQATSEAVLKALLEIESPKAVVVKITFTTSKNKHYPMWSKHFVLRGAEYVENTVAVNKLTFILGIVIALVFVWIWSAFSYRPPVTSVASNNINTPPEAPRTFLGKSESGYELWTDGRCVFVKDVRTSDLARLNTDIEGFKKAVKDTTGKQCVLFE
jgi:hypothetical protein